MSEPNRIPSENDNLVTSLKIGVFMTVLGWMVLAVEAPQLVAMPGGDAAPVTVATSAAHAPALTAVDYFPAQFPAPKGGPEPAPPTF